MKNQKFPNPCSRCGMCCLSVTCEVGQMVFGIPSDELCHALVFEGETAICKLAPQLVPVGDGCCIKARAYSDGICYDFSKLSPTLKKAAAQQLRVKGCLAEATGGR